jgi:tRNA A37 methylthiotransferase MiaB
VAGPDAYRDLPRLIGLVRGGAGSAMNVQLSADETYADIVPVRADGAVSAFLSVMRGCNNMCSFCIVPFTRGRERSRPTASVLDEVRALAEQGVKEVTLLGQNVNSFADFSERGGGSGEAQDEQPSASASASPSDAPFAAYAPGFRSVYVPRRGGAVRFAELLERVAGIDPEMRIRFTSPHPKDFPLEVLQAVRAHANVCKQLHLPAQSGASGTLSRMRRGYDREAYLALAARVREELPGVALSSDFISGFCGETEEEHADTLSLLRAVRYEHAFLFAYSRREKTAAARHLEDDVPPDVKQRRLEEARRAAFADTSHLRQACGVRALTVCLRFLRRSSQPSARAPRSAPRRRLGACTACWSRAPPAAPRRPLPAARTPTSASCSRTSRCRQSSPRRAAVPRRPPCG